jgi:hypothetical protein
MVIKRAKKGRRKLNSYRPSSKYNNPIQYRHQYHISYYLYLKIVLKAIRFSLGISPIVTGSYTVNGFTLCKL